MHVPAHLRNRSVLAALATVAVLTLGACSDDGGSDGVDLTTLATDECPGAVGDVIDATEGEVQVADSTEPVTDPREAAARNAIESAGGGVGIECTGPKGTVIVSVLHGDGAANLLLPAMMQAAELTADDAESFVEEGTPATATTVGEGVAIRTFDVDGAGSAAVLVTDGDDQAADLADEVADAVGDGHQLSDE